MLIRTSIAVAALSIGNFAFAEMTPVGTWHTIDDNTKEVKSSASSTESTLKKKKRKILSISL